MPGYVAAKEECVEGNRDGFQTEVRVLGKSEQLIWVRLKATAIRKADGSLDCLLLMLEDLTAWKETEASLKEGWEKLRATEEKLRAVEGELGTEQAYFRVLFDGAGMGIVLLDRDDKMLEVNPAFERMLGYGSGELQGKTLEEISHPDDNKLSAKCHRQCLDGQLPHYEIEKCLRNKDQGVVWVRMTVATITRPDGAMESAYATFEDITPRKNAEQALAASQSKLHLSETQLEESRARFRDVLNGIAVGAAVFDNEGRLVETNAMLQKMFGMRAEELASKKLADLVHPDDLGADAAAFQDCVDGKRQELELEKRFLKADKGEFWADLALSVVRDEDGVFKYAVGVLVPFAEEEAQEKPDKPENVPAAPEAAPETSDAT
jgi:PAS domain S-box-containing protein